MVLVPQIVLVAQRRADNVSQVSLPAKVYVYVTSVSRRHYVIPRECTDGKQRQRGRLIYSLEGFDAVQGPLIDVFMLPSEN
jgi:hypothetical protein